MKLFQDITLGQYFPGESLLHRLDPRTKLFVLMVFIATVFMTGNIYSLFITLFSLLLVVKSASLSVRYLLKSARLFFWFFAFTAIFHLFYTPGDSVYPFPFWGINVTRQGVEYGSLVFLQLFLVIVAANLFTLTTSPSNLTASLDKLLLPLNKLGLKTEGIPIMISLVIRFIPILKIEIEKIVAAHKVKGVDFNSGSPVRKIKIAANILGPLLMNIFRRSDDLAIAMICRGYGGDCDRGTLREVSFKWIDIATICAIIAFSGLIAFYR